MSAKETDTSKSSTQVVVIRSIDTPHHHAHLSDDSTQSLIDLPDLPHRKAPRKRSKKTGPARDISANPTVRAALILHSPESYQILRDVHLGTHHGSGGHPRIYPTPLWSLLYCLQNAIGTHVALESYANLYYHFDVIVDQIRHLLHELDPAEADVARRWLANPAIPSAPHIGRLFKSLKQRGFDMSDALIQQGTAIAIQDGRFTDRLSAYATVNTVAGDGTVTKAASDSRHPLTVDPDTGEVTSRRVDDMALLHHEGGSDQPTVYGAKWAGIVSKSCERHGHIFLAGAWVHSPAPAVEADMAVDLILRISEELAPQNAQIANVVYDKATNASHQRLLNEHGMVLNTRAMADGEGQEDSHYRDPKYIGSLTAPCGRRIYFAAIMKQLHQQVLTVDGTLDYLLLEHHNTVQRRSGRNYHYTRFEYRCDCAADMTHSGSIGWNGWRNAQRNSKDRITFLDEDQYMNALRYLQPVAPGTPQFDAVYGTRNITETTHSTLDDLLPFKRLQRWGEAAKSAFMYGYMMGWNIVFSALRNHDLLVKLRLRRPPSQT
jgi:hypothetical protein